jgi:hypothetical protein
MRSFRPAIYLLTASLLAVAIVSPAFSSARPDDKALNDLLGRTAEQMTKFVDQFSEVKCTEHVMQERFGKNDKVERRAEATYDYLVILSNAGGELSLDESRLEVQAPNKVKKSKDQSMPMMISNGFATLFLIFHPYYAESFSFTSVGEEVLEGRRLAKVHFAHIRNTRSVAVLAVKGKEYPLDLSGTAWIEPETGRIARLEAGVTSDVEDIGMKALHSDIRFAPVRFGNKASDYWYPVQASVDVETPRQHWRNTHNFSDYKQFSVSTEQQVAKQ